MNIHFWILVSENRQLPERNQEQKLEFAPNGVDFTRLRLQGVWRYLRDVDEVNCPRFLIT